MQDSQSPSMQRGVRLVTKIENRYSFYICKSAMLEDGFGSITNHECGRLYKCGFAVANGNVKASIVHDVPVLGNKNPSTWEQYADGNKRVQELLQGTKPDEDILKWRLYLPDDMAIPSDERYSRQFVRKRTYDSYRRQEIPPSKLDTEFFTIYWYSFQK